MKMENQVCSLVLAIILKDLGVPQNSFFIYRKYQFSEVTDLHPKPIKGTELATLSGQLEFECAAFTVAELGEMLPEVLPFLARATDYDCQYEITINKLHDEWEISYCGTGDAGCYVIMKDKNEANCRARMIAYLIENKLLKL